MAGRVRGLLRGPLSFPGASLQATGSKGPPPARRMAAPGRPPQAGPHPPCGPSKPALGCVHLRSPVPERGDCHSRHTTAGHTTSSQWDAGRWPLCGHRGFCSLSTKVRARPGEWWSFLSCPVSGRTAGPCRQAAAVFGRREGWRGPTSQRCPLPLYPALPPGALGVPSRRHRSLWLRRVHRCRGRFLSLAVSALCVAGESERRFCRRPLGLMHV